MVKNTNKCPAKIWKKFSATEKELYNKLRWLLDWKELYHTKIKEDNEIIDVTSHNIACQIVWNLDLAKCKDCGQETIFKV